MFTIDTGGVHMVTMLSVHVHRYRGMHMVAMWSVHVYHRYRGCVYGCYAECPCL